MAGQGRGKHGQPASARVSKGRRLIIVCLTRTISDVGASNAAVARWIGITESTLYTWLRFERPASVEKILDCPQLADGFRRLFCTFDHSPSSAPYIAKAPKRKPGA